MTRFRFLGLLPLALAAAASACLDFTKNAVQDIGGPAAATRVRFFNFGVNAPAVNFYANDQKITAISSTTGNESTGGVAYGGVGSGGFYSAIDPGQYTLSGRISAAVDKDLPISSVSASLADGKAYSFYMSGFYNATTKTVDGFIVEDALPAEIDWSVALVRFVHAISNANPMGLVVRNRVTNTETAIGSTVAYKAAGAFTAIPGGLYDLNTRFAGQSANAVTRAEVAFVPGRAYTITARGDITVVSTTATNRPFLDNTLNR